MSELTSRTELVALALLDGWRNAARRMGPIDPEAEAIVRSISLEQAPRVARAVDAVLSAGERLMDPTDDAIWQLALEALKDAP